MNIKVRTPYLRDFKMPSNCVACGSSPAFASPKNVSLQKNFGGKLHTLTLGFPLCSECHTVSQKKTHEKQAIILAVIVALALIFVSAGLSVKNETSIFIIFGIVIGIVWAALTTLWIIKDNRKIFTKEELERRTQVTLCATIRNFEHPWMGNEKGFIDFRFMDSSFAEQFSNLNEGTML